MIQYSKGGNLAKKKYGPLETVSISGADYDIIYSTGYEDCLLDYKTQLINLIEEIELDNQDALEVLKGFVEGLGQAIGDTGVRQ